MIDMTSANPHIIVVGDPCAGFSYHGPFDSDHEAEKYAERNGHKFDADWWIAPLHGTN